MPGKEKSPSVCIWTRNQPVLGHVWLYKPQSRGIRTGGRARTPFLCTPWPLSLLPCSGWDGEDVAASSCCQALGTAPAGGSFLSSPLQAKPAAKLSTRVIISQDLWRKPKSRAVLVINQKFFAQFPNRFPGDLLIGTPHSTAPSPWMAAPSLQAQGLGWGETPGFGIIQAPPSINKSPWMHQDKPQQSPPAFKSHLCPYRVLFGGDGTLLFLTLRWGGRNEIRAKLCRRVGIVAVRVLM